MKPKQKTEDLVLIPMLESHYKILQKYSNHLNTTPDALMNCIFEFYLSRPKLLQKVIDNIRKPRVEEAIQLV